MQVELAIVEWVGWYDHRRLHGELDDVPPSEFEAAWRGELDSPYGLAQPATPPAPIAAD